MRKREREREKRGKKRLTHSCCLCYRVVPLPRRLVRAQYPDNVPMIVSGVSMGGLVATYMALETSKESEALKFAACLLVVGPITWHD